MVINGIRITDLSVSFAEKPVLRGISLDIAGCGVFGLIGRSGSGKTTLLRAINRLNEEFPACHTTGKIELLSAVPTAAALDITTISLPQLRRTVGMVFQSPSVLPVSIEKNMSLPLRLVTDFSPQNFPQIIRSSLEDVGLWEGCRDRLDAPASSLSGGQQQRLCLARTLALKPSILLLDEPTASLDVHSTEEVERLIEKLSQQYLILMVSHSIAQARRLCSRIYVMRDGQLDVQLEKSSIAKLSDAEFAKILG